ncbi:hypothetical protein PV04_05229 [Phialophora macrospora]|uniref:Uncharacterized protein n=1 Tax=Phialophora macrospora TaxID=1851006 RepID=A0A0D2FMH4_9EURO|nr:hypothetical protein PV04_05229 [Phialophora macrospora]
MADYEESNHGISQLEERLADAVSGYANAHDDPDMDDAGRHKALHHHSTEIAYTAQEILTHDPDHSEAQKLLTIFALSLNGQFRHHHYRTLGLVEDESEYEELEHVPWMPEHLPDEDHSGLLEAMTLPSNEDHRYHGDDDDEVNIEADYHESNEDDYERGEDESGKGREHGESEGDHDDLGQ